MLLVLGFTIYPAIAGYADYKIIEVESSDKFQYVEAVSSIGYIKPVLKITYPPQWTKCSCVEFAKWYLGKQGEVWGVAKNIVPTSPVPYVGGLVITMESKLGHVAVIKEVRENSLLVVEANYKRCQQGEREIRLNDPNIVGYK